MFDETLSSRVARLEEANRIALEKLEQAADGAAATAIAARREDAQKLQSSLELIDDILTASGF